MRSASSKNIPRNLPAPLPAPWTNTSPAFRSPRGHAAQDSRRHSFRNAAGRHRNDQLSHPGVRI